MSLHSLQIFAALVAVAFGCIDAEAAPEVSSIPPMKAQGDAKALRLSAAQRPSDSELIVSITLTNVSSHPISVLANPHLDGLDADISLHLTDVRERTVPVLCKIDRKHVDAPQRQTLAPGGFASFAYHFGPGCYLLDPGERLRLDAAYCDAGRGCLSANPGTRVDLVKSLAVVVPQGWPARGRK